MRIRRSRAIIIRFEARPALNLEQMLRGELALVPQARPVAVSSLTGQNVALDGKHLRFLSEINSWEWLPSESLTERFGVSGQMIEVFLAAGLLIGDDETSQIRKLREREERLAAMEWDEYAFNYHMANRTRDQDPFRGTAPPADLGSTVHPRSEAERDPFAMMAQLSQQLVATAYQYGPAPPHFFEVPGALEQRELPTPAQDGPLYRLLRERKTVRLFDPKNPMTEEELSTVLYFTFGCHGVALLTEGVVAVRKTSPSGGALHPIEAYPLVLNVKDWPTGLYHYNVQNHRMDLLRNLTQEMAMEMAEKFTAGQTYFATAHVLCILTARFYRNFWKYRRAPRSFRVIQLDAGHLSQTFSLVCTELRLGSFFTAAINDINIEEELGIDAVEQGAVGIVGCGRPVDSYAFTLETRPYLPRVPLT